MPAALCSAVIAIWLCSIGFLSASETLPQSVYVWQRNWTSSVRDSVTNLAPHFSSLVPLATEIVWQKEKPQAIHVALDYDVLRQTKCPIGLALRIGSFSGPFTAETDQTKFILHEIDLLVRTTAAQHLPLTELQIDFDCAESKLAGYEVWVKTIREKFPTLPLAITALPTWLARPEFVALARTAGGYVLQVHSFARPKDFATPFSLCDPVKAQQAVTAANALKIPFRVALPTYGYTLAFTPDGKFLGLSAEISKAWPAGTKTKISQASPSELAKLVHAWTAQRPPFLQGIIWYRLPVKGDFMNWSWPTLSSVMQGTAPQAHVEIKATHPEEKLVEIDLENSGNAEIAITNSINVYWAKSEIIASDAQNNFDFIDSGKEKVQFRFSQFLPPLILKPGDKCVVGWLRFTQKNTEVRCEFSSE